MEIKITTDDLVSVIEAANRLGWPKMRIYRWVDGGKMLGVRLGGVLFIPVSEVERLRDKTGLSTNRGENEAE